MRSCISGMYFSMETIAEIRICAMTYTRGELCSLSGGSDLFIVKIYTKFYTLAITIAKSATSGKAGGLKKVEPLKADRSCEPLKAVRL